MVLGSLGKSSDLKLYLISLNLISIILYLIFGMLFAANILWASSLKMGTRFLYHLYKLSTTLFEVVFFLFILLCDTFGYIKVKFGFRIGELIWIC